MLHWKDTNEGCELCVANQGAKIFTVIVSGVILGIVAMSHVSLPTSTMYLLANVNEVNHDSKLDNMEKEMVIIRKEIQYIRTLIKHLPMNRTN